MIVPILCAYLVASVFVQGDPATEHPVNADAVISTPHTLLSTDDTEGYFLSTKDSNDTCHDTRKIKPLCTICKIVIKIIKNQIANDTTQEKIKEVLKTICTKVPKIIQGGCHTFVDKYADLIIPLLVEKLSAKKICKKIRLCKKWFDLDLYHGSKTCKSEPAISPACVVCKYLKMVMNEETFMGKKQEDMLDEEKMCFDLPLDIQEECIAVMFLIETTSRLIPPLDVCKTMCFSPPERHSTHVTPNHCDVGHVKSITCDGCISIMDNIKAAIKDMVLPEIVEVLDELCVEMEAPLAPLCIVIINEFANEIVNLLVNGATSEEICKHIYMC